MPIASDIILDWAAKDGYSLSEAGWIRPQESDNMLSPRRPVGRVFDG